MTFNGDIKKFINAAEKDIEAVISDSFSDSAEIVVDKTAVDTGRAKANWNASIGSPNGSTSDSVDPTGGSTKSAAKINIDIGKNAYFTNSLPYIVHLEFGTSKMAAQPMVALAVVNWKRTVDKNVRKHK